MTKSNFFKRLLPFLLAFLLVIPSLTAFAATDDATDSGSNDGVTWEKVDDVEIDGLKLAHEYEGDIDTDSYVAAGNVRVSIIVEGKSTMDAGYDTKGIGTNPNAKRYRGEVLAKQQALARKISAEALGGAELDVVWNLTLAANIISANVPAIKIDEIKKVDGVKDVIIETQYEAPVTETSDDPNMSNASAMTGAQVVWASGYTGAGSKVAIIDTGLDTDHQSFDAESFDYAIEETEKTVDLLDEDDIEAVWDQLNIKARLKDADSSDLYVSTKVPFGANYVDSDLDITHDNDSQGEHGSHVAGIAAANRFVKIDGEFTNALESVLTQGEAPDAQLIIMKVFGKGGGAYDSDYFAAIEDAILLGADSVNLSLGSAAAGFATNNTYNEILEAMTQSDTVVTISAGNSGYWAERTVYGSYGYGPYAGDANFDMVGSPGSYANALTVASVDNDGITGNYLKLGEDMIFFTETSGYGNEPFASIAGDYEYVFINGVGTDEQFAALADKLSGKIAVCNRGETSFFEKANAAAKNGAAAVVIANNQDGTISMNLTGYTYKVPVVSITQADGALLAENATETGTITVDDTDFTVYYGSITVAADVATVSYGSKDYTMSSFSSWGVPGDLTLKPEITAPGGNIYSVNGAVAGGQAYENMSGTSMAAPQIAGLSAVLKQYIRENELADKTGLSERQLTNSLLMSTAQPMVNAESECYYPVFQQGAGLVDLNAATNSRTYIMMDESATASAADGKVKVELGDDPDRTGKYSAAFTMGNMSDEPIMVYLDSEFMTQDLYYFLRDTWTVPLKASATWYVNGNPVDGVFDFNGDGIGNEDDVQTLLDYAVGNIDEISNAAQADFDNDGDIDSYDAYLALKMNEFSTYAYIPANGTVDIKVEFAIEGLDDYDANGTYIEGYIWALEADMADGAIGTWHSIPVVGYYGSWSEPGWNDVGSYLEYLYEEEDRYPYMYYELEDEAFEIETYLIKYAGSSKQYYFGGNPYDTDEEYMPERNAMSSNDTISAFQYTLTRNAAGTLFEVLDEEGNVLPEYTVEGGSQYAAYYHVNQGVWYNTSTSFKPNFTPAGVKEGTVLTMMLTTATEYYKNADGTIRWDDLDKNASLPFQVVIDDTDPVISNVEIVKDDEGNVTALKVTASDNQYIAAIALYTEDDEFINYFGSDVEAEPGEAKEYTFDLSEVEAKHLYVFAGDYAANESIYKINLNPEELVDPEIEVTVSPDEYIIIAGNSIKLTASVMPWGIDESVTWTSSDESVATVDEAGFVTGIDVGDVIITATSVLDTTKSATAKITVIKIDKTLNGIVWDEEGDVWFSEFNLNSLPKYTKLSGNVRLPIASLAYDESKVMYGASYDSGDDISSLYVIDESTYEATLIGNSEIGYWDLAASPSLTAGGDINVMLAVYGTYVVIVNKDTGDYEGAFNLSRYTGGANLIGIAYEEPYDSAYGMSDFYFVLDENGVLYSVGFLPYNGSYANFTPQSIGQIAEGVDVPFYQSFYYDGASLYWSRYNQADNAVNIIMVNDIYNDGSIYNVGYFNDSVWPVGGLYEAGTSPAFAATGSASADKSAFVLDDSSVFVETIEPVEIDRSAAVKGSVHAAVSTGVAVERAIKTGDEINGSGVSKVVLDVTADAAEEEIVHNGLYEITYDPTILEVTPAAAESDFKSTKASEGKIVFGYVDIDGYKNGDTVLSLTVNHLDKTKEGVLEIKTLDNGSENPGTVERFVFNPEGGVINEYGVTGVAFDDESLKVKVGSETPLAYAITPDNATNRNVVFTSSNEEVATVDENGVLTAVAPGKVVVTIKTEDGGYTDEVAVIVMFDDVQNAKKFYFDPVYWAVENGITTGLKGTNNFDPEGNCSREQVVTFLYRIAKLLEIEGYDSIATENPFTDVKSTKYYYEAIMWAVQNDITTGTSATKFGVGDDCTREQVCTFLWRLAGKPAPQTTENPFTDVKAGKWYADAVLWAFENGITTGTSATTFGVGSPCTRGQIVTFLYRFANMQ